MLRRNIELKFRIQEGTDICHATYPLSTTVEGLKEMLLADWPQDTGGVVPTSIEDMRIIHAGRVLKDGKTLARSKLKFRGMAPGPITMHVVVRPPENRPERPTRPPGSENRPERPTRPPGSENRRQRPTAVAERREGATAVNPTCCGIL